MWKYIQDIIRGTSDNEWYVISGGPSVGKSTLIELIASDGLATVPEMARLYIDQELAMGKSLYDIVGDQQTFQRTIPQLQIDAEQKADPHTVTFFDRGIPDMLAYYRYYTVPEDALITHAVARCSYKKVFLLDPLPLVSDYARQENEQQQREICELIHEVYHSLSFPVVHVPVLTPEERLTYIIDNM